MAGKNATVPLSVLIEAGRWEEAIDKCDNLILQQSGARLSIVKGLAGTMVEIQSGAAEALEKLGLFKLAEPYRQRAFAEATVQAYGPGPHRTTAPITARAIESGGSLCDNLDAQGKPCSELRASVRLATWLRRSRATSLLSDRARESIANSKEAE